MYISDQCFFFFFPQGLAGTWGHDGKAVDAVRFSPNKGIVLGGLGVYGCRSPGTYEVTVSEFI